MVTRVSAQKGEQVIRGTVTDTRRQPLAFASVKLVETDFIVAADNKGIFRLPVPAHGLDSVTLMITHVNKQAARRIIYRADFAKNQVIALAEQSLSLQEVEVQARRENAHSVSSIVFDHEAIMQSQAFSLADILNKLPGKLTTAPSLQSPQTLTLRTSAAGINAMNNSFGIAIYIDGVRISNDANMQSRSVSIWGVQNSSISSHTDDGKSYDVTYNGFDLRDIPIERIERIEVIQGVADARYGEMTSGAILITTRAGRTPVGIAVNLNGGSVQVTGSRVPQYRADLLRKKIPGPGPVPCYRARRRCGQIQNPIAQNSHAHQPMDA
jgi:hypothetical protein